jgi:hypothetical protein
MAFKMKGSPMQRNYGIGASPVKQTKVNVKTGKVEIDLTKKPVGTGTVLKPKKKGIDYAAMQAKSAKKDPRYGKMTAAEYKTEVQRQVKSKKETGSYDAMGAYDHKGKKKVVKTTPPPSKKETKVTTPKTKTKVTTPKKTKAKDPLTRLGDRITRKSRMVKAATDQGVSKKEAKKMYKTVVKETKKAKKIDKIAATADVKTARAKYGRGSAEVKAAKAKRRKIRKTRIEDYKTE